MSVATDESIFGKYKLVSSDENLDGFLKELGVGFMTRKLANLFSPVIEMAKDDNGNFVVKAQTWAKTLESRFQLGEEFEEDRFDGKKCKSTVVQQGGNTFIQTQKDGNIEVKYIREFAENQLRVTSIANNVKCFRVYEKLPEGK